MADNIFTALVRQKTPGVITEFVLWCMVCFAALMSLIALAMGGGQITWILMMLFAAGLAVLMVFRLKAIVMLYGVGVFQGIIFLVHYLCFSVGYTSGESHSALNLVLFILTLMLALAAIICAFVQFFSKYQLGTALTILVLLSSATAFVLQILLYTSEYLGSIDYLNGYHQVWMNSRGYWVGTVSFWILITVVAVYYACFFWGPIDKRKGKLYVSGGGSVQAGLRGVSGVYAGRVIYLHGGAMTIGSGEQAMLRIPDGNVSRLHCIVRFNTGTGFYEIQDQSANGVYLANGAPLQKGVYHAVRRGSVIWIGSQQQQFQLL